MEDWVKRALARWPNVPALYGWLKLDRRGRWLIKNESISRSQIIDVINRNYAADERGCWFFQNGPQRGYLQLERAPFIFESVDNIKAGGTLQTHTQVVIEKIESAFLDEEGGFYLQTDQGPGAVRDSDLDWVLSKLTVDDKPVTPEDLEAALSLPSGKATALQLRVHNAVLSIVRLDNADAPSRLHFVRDPTAEIAQSV